MGNQITDSKTNGRLLSLDVLRGLIIVGMISGGLGSSLKLGLPVLDSIAKQFSHTPWHGLTFYDIVAPAFLFIVGVAMSFSFAKRMTEGVSESKLRIHALKRSVILFLLGTIRVSIHENSPFLFELSSALQSIAIAYFIAYLFLGKNIKIRGVISVVILLFYWLILELIPAPNIPAGTLEKNHNIVWYVDNLLLGRAHSNGWGTLLLFLPQTTHTIIGTMIGSLLRSGRSQQEKIKLLLIPAVSCIILGAVMDFVMPIIQKIWTPSYAVITTGWSLLFMLICYWLLDVKGIRYSCAFFFMIFGMNAIALYMGNSMFGGRFSYIVNVFIRDIAGALGQLGPLFTFLIVLLAKWLVFYWMYKRRIFIKV